MGKGRSKREADEEKRADDIITNGGITKGNILAPWKLVYILIYIYIYIAFPILLVQTTTRHFYYLLKGGYLCSVCGGYLWLLCLGLCLAPLSLQI